MNLTCLRNGKQHYCNDMKYYVACKTRHLITNLIVVELNLTCLREMKQQLNDKVEQITIHPTTYCLTHRYIFSWQIHYS
jgi:hypothetical protein